LSLVENTVTEFKGEYTSDIVKTANESVALDLLKDKDFIVRKDVELVLSLSQTVAGRVLKSLLNKGEIRAVGVGKNIRYVLNE
jgi:ATP-dependent DNA helicase RecG